MTARKWSAWVVETLKTAVAVIAKRAAIAPLILCGGLMAAPSALAVGLGEISVNSSLNEPLNASIALLSSEDLQDGQILVSLASPEAFERVGLSRDFLLTQLKFAVERDGANVRVIKVSSEQAITEPYLNFLVQLQWPAGRVQREYTVLLDLPIYSAQNSTAQIAPAQTAAVSNTRIQSNKSAQGKQGESDSFSQTRRLRSQPPLSGDQHRVVVGDTLWNVAERLRPQDATIQQAMDALYRHNADAFVQGDANQIKEGSVLRLPTDSEIQQESGTRVVAQIGLVPAAELTPFSVAGQSETTAITDTAADSDGSSTSQSQSEDDAFTSNTEGRLELASSYENQKGSGTLAVGATGAEPSDDALLAYTNDISQLAAELAVATDEVNKTQQENSELRERMALLEAQVETMAALVDGAAAAPAKQSPAKKATDNSITAWLMALPGYIWAIVVGLIAVVGVFFARKATVATEDKGYGDELPSGYESYDGDAVSAAPSHSTLHALDDLDLNPDDNLFDESDADIFDSAEENANAETFDMMVEAVAEAEVYLSLGNTAQAIQVLEEAREADPLDASSRLKLMEILFTEDRKAELAPLYKEIQDTDDEAAIEMAAIIAGPEVSGEVVIGRADEANTAELEIDGLYVDLGDSESAFDGDDGASDDSSDDEAPLPSTDDAVDTPDDGLELEDFTLEGMELENIDDLDAIDLEDMDLDNLTADDFDIEPAGSDSSTEIDELTSNTLSSEQIDSDNSADELFAEISEISLEPFADLDDIDVLDAVDVKLDLAKTYVEMGDPEGAREILQELIEESGEEDAAKAKALLETR